MYYHVTVEFVVGRSSKTTEKYELDLTREDLITKIAGPFVSEQRFMCGGAFVEPKGVREIHFTETSQSSVELLPFIRAERSRSGIVSVRSDEEFVAGKGREVTREILEEVEKSMEAASNAKVGKEERSSRRIFIVHGHDISALDQTEVLLRRWGFEPVILRDQPNSGLTVIEKIEANSDVAYAIILLTPDDICTAGNPRARQNVVFEWGYLMAKLGRKDVMVLRKADTELPSDLHGIVRIDFTGDVKDKAFDIQREFSARGLEIKKA